ncbi:MAG: hypothetical protein JWO11_4456 [Nocardioides sp.]|nr:hypothetical protein [Nocardioides sp.]
MALNPAFDPGPGPRPAGPTHPAPTRPAPPPRPTMPRPATPRPFAGHLPIGASIDHLLAAGEELTPSSAVALCGATRKSTEVLVALGAGASHRHEPEFQIGTGEK